jgi:hypothetical protein
MNNKKIQLSILTIFLAATLVGSAATFGVDNVQAAGDKDHKKDKYDDKDRDHDKKEMKHDDHGDKYHEDKKEIKYYDKNGNSNYASQSIDQIQVSEQNAQCVSGTFTALSCNNVGLQFQINDGNLALGQQ